VETLGLAQSSGLSTEIVETIFQSRDPSTMKVYTLKWTLFTSWCGEHQLDPVICPVVAVLEILQEGFSTGLSPSTLKVYMAALAYHVPLSAVSLGRHPLVMFPLWHGEASDQDFRRMAASKTFVFKTINGLAQVYLADLVTVYQPPRTLRSSEQTYLVIPKFKYKKFGGWSFAVQGPKLWNALPTFLRSITVLGAFKSQLKTYLFRQAFNM